MVNLGESLTFRTTDSPVQEKTCIVVPAFNEAENLESVLPEIQSHLDHLGHTSTILVVDDGSTDSTRSVLTEIQKTIPSLNFVRLNRNSGKAVALKLGFDTALEMGATKIVMMDADGQDDPAELATLLSKMDDGFDLVTGARVSRQDRFVKRTTSRLYNKVTAVLSGAPGKDFNSGFKAMTAETARTVSTMLYGDMHRYITVVGFWQGAATAEVPVNHRERLHGNTKYGLNRFWRGFMDLLTIRFLMSYQNRPSHLFGGLGILSGAVGMALLAYLFIEKLGGATIGTRPMLTIAVLLVVVGLQLFIFGLLAELIVNSRQRSSADKR